VVSLPRISLLKQSAPGRNKQRLPGGPNNNPEIIQIQGGESHFEWFLREATGGRRGNKFKVFTIVNTIEDAYTETG
jgi:hypothetical protein